MGIGTAKEGGGAVIETIGLRDSEDSEETEFEADDQGDDLEGEDQGDGRFGIFGEFTIEEEAEHDQFKIEAVDESEASICRRGGCGECP